MTCKSSFNGAVRGGSNPKTEVGKGDRGEWAAGIKRKGEGK